MTTQEKIRRLASSVMDVPSMTPMASHPVIAGPPFAIRKVPFRVPLAAEKREHPVPVATFRSQVSPKVARDQEARALISKVPARRNRRRTRPPLALAVCGLLATSAAQWANTPRGEETMVAMVPAMLGRAGDGSMMASHAAGR